jgi:hypothetical protein
MKPNCAQLALDLIGEMDEKTKRKARKVLEEICMQHLPYRYAGLCAVMNPMELYKICEESYTAP